jgi:CDP-diacylglycerol--serine O-phosphatidyltransferase
VGHGINGNENFTLNITPLDLARGPVPAIKNRGTKGKRARSALFPFVYFCAEHSVPRSLEAFTHHPSPIIRPPSPVIRPPPPLTFIIPQLCVCCKQILPALKKLIPNSFTALNLFFGCQSIISSLEGNLQQAAWFIGIAAILDFFDGFVARLLNAYSEIGKQLDSLADVVSFGVAPGMIFYVISQDHLLFGNSFPMYVPLLIVFSYLPFLIPIFSAVRLAKFNIDTRQSDSFIGLPTPANALFICAIPFVLESGPDWAAILFASKYFLLLFPIVSSYLLVAELPLFALKFKNFSFTDNSLRYLFLLGCGVLIFFFHYFGVGLSIVLYVLLSLLVHLKLIKL